MFLLGDRNLKVDGVETKPGVVSLTTINVFGWTRAIHHRSGNVALGDGSVQSLDNRILGEALARSGAATNRLVIP